MLKYILAALVTPFIVITNIFLLQKFGLLLGMSDVDSWTLSFIFSVSSIIAFSAAWKFKENE